MADKIDPKDLMEKARAGDQEAFSLLYEQYLTPIFRYIYFRILHKEDAEDLLQTVFLKAYRALPKFQNMGKDPLTFFYTIARNAVIDYRRKKREVFAEDTEEFAQRIVDTAPSAVDIITARDESALVLQALKSIGDDQREALTLKYINDMSNEEIAQLMQKQEPAIRQLHSRGLKALREKLWNTKTKN